MSEAHHDTDEPGQQRRWVRPVLIAVLVLVVVWVLFTWVFPWVTDMGFNPAME